MIELMESSTELMKQASTGLGFDADVEPDRRVEAHLLVDEQVVSSAWKARRSSSDAK